MLRNYFASLSVATFLKAAFLNICCRGESPGGLRKLLALVSHPRPREPGGMVFKVSRVILRGSRVENRRCQACQHCREYSQVSQPQLRRPLSVKRPLPPFLPGDAPPAQLSSTAAPLLPCASFFPGSTGIIWVLVFPR